MVIKALVRRNTYFDSITLMQTARFLAGLPGIEDAAAIMATEPNRQLLAEAGFAPLEAQAGAADTLLVVRGADEQRAGEALEAGLEHLLQRATPTDEAATGAPRQPRSLEQALRAHPQARLAAISVPGPYAALEAERALRSGLHVFLFSDNVPLEDEISLKQLAQERGLLLMGPDCGTAMLDGAALGFVNVVSRGPIGIVGASGTGIQQVMSLIAQHGGGVSQVIGSGGRDLSQAVGGITTLQGLRLLQADEQTKVIVLISKPPAPGIAEQVMAVAAESNKPVVVIFVGADHNALQNRYGQTVTIARTLAEAAGHALRLSGHKFVADLRWDPVTEPLHFDNPSLSGPLTHTLHSKNAPGLAPRKGPFLSGLFSGGTLCDETMHIWAERGLSPIYSNIPLDPAWQLAAGARPDSHCAIDFGADEYTRGRPHPMIDPSLRLKRMQEDAANPLVGVILLDIVLGYCSHPYPARVYAPAIQAARQQAADDGRVLNVVISMCGTEGDPQRLSLQTEQFREAGSQVYASNAAAALRCIELLS